jgi:2-keto-4-pentenoate hydratase
MTTSVATAADRLREAALTHTPCAPVRDLLGTTDIALAYRVQRTLTEARLADGARIVGHKIGLTSPAVQRQLGVDRPDFGVLFDDMLWDESRPIPAGRLLQPKAEAEIAFILAEDLDDGELTPQRIRAAVDYAVPALEIVDSRIRDWDISITDTIADNASCGLFVLGRGRASLDDFEAAAAIMSMRMDGVEVSRGDGRACLGDPLTALAWLARTARQVGTALRKGDVVLSGALGAMVSVSPGSCVEAEISVLGRVSVSFATGEAR